MATFLRFQNRWTAEAASCLFFFRVQDLADSWRRLADRSLSALRFPAENFLERLALNSLTTRILRSQTTHPSTRSPLFPPPFSALLLSPALAGPSGKLLALLMYCACCIVLSSAASTLSSRRPLIARPWPRAAGLRGGEDSDDSEDSD